ncbi:glycoside hydrolase family 3 N-terminal domain-containing protein [Microvirga rosea]|uniref:glycoside hydrolase family 3 N-terminal domain-containing protein n=1 Tax=Microvirga rosea TaxID=2715425 RepID=UPI001D0BA19F|nr:glycoside hydrolase family 3 N-terminal domain-containing protein [Microvirga rosea]MCB8822994.1 glycoside hydrolase family 3 C-terminal domain-containing protein [Microvirga rosea]
MMVQSTGFFAFLRLGLAAFFAVAFPAAGQPQEEVEKRVNDLLRTMTLEEKIGQLNMVSNGALLRWDDISSGRVGALLNFNNAQDIARAQAAARQSRLKIPVLFGLDILHGFRTQFPIPLGEAAAFNPRLSRLASEWAAREASYIGVQWTFAPMADLSRDSRWGRIVEGFGEDPYLGSVLTAARVEGFSKGGLATATKHFAGYGAPQGGRDYDTTYIPPAEMYDTYLPPFRAAVEAGSVSFMAAFNALNGVPSTANAWLQTDVLRKRWGFDGFVTSDWAGINELIGHGIAEDGAEAARKAILAGVDMDMMGELYIRYLPEEVRSGRVPESVIDEAARRILRSKMRLGLFDRPDADPKHVDSIFPSAEARQAAREVAQETIVLLQNRNKVLPISGSVRSIAVVGPLADAPLDQFGPHGARGHAQDSVSILQGVRAKAEQSGIQIRHAIGCDLVCHSSDQLPAALEAVKSSDLTIAVFGEPADLSGEAASRAHLALNGKQEEILRALAAAGKPIALVIIGGRPLELGTLPDQIPSVLMAWYPGTEGGPALADILFGDVNPSGKLPLSWPRSVGQLPLYYNRLPTGRPTLENNRFTLKYVDEAITPLYPFGWGLSYTQFAYSRPEITKTHLKAGDILEVSVQVTNEGSQKGHEVVQLYTRDPVASRSRPLRELKAFEKIFLEPGQSKRVTFQILVNALGFHQDDGSYWLEKGAIQIFVGGNSLADLSGEIFLEETVTVPLGEQRAISSMKVYRNDL